MKFDDLYQAITESLDSAYPWSHSTKSNNKELYFIDLPNGHEIAVNMIVERGKPKPEVEFTSTDYDPEDIFKITGTFARDGMNPIRVFTALVQVIKQSQLIKKHNGFVMNAYKAESSRVSLYKKLLNKFGLKFTTADNGRNILFEIDI
jgi:hypothetical protein